MATRLYLALQSQEERFGDVLHIDRSLNFCIHVLDSNGFTYCLQRPMTHQAVAFEVEKQSISRFKSERDKLEKRNLSFTFRFTLHKYFRFSVSNVKIMEN